MKLTYRGVSYEAQPSQLQVIQGGVLGSYRGAPWRAQTLVNPPAPPLAATLTYRGVRYQHGQLQPEQSVSGVSVVSVPVAASTDGLQMSRMQRRHVNSALETAHRHAILNNLERRLKAARNRGDERLVRMLEAEWQQFA